MDAACDRSAPPRCRGDVGIIDNRHLGLNVRMRGIPQFSPAETVGFLDSRRQGIRLGFDVDPTTGGLVFTAINNGVSVPEPSALAVLAASLAGFWLVQARRIRRRSVAAI